MSSQLDPPNLLDVPAQVSSELLKKEDEDLRQIIRYESVTVERSMKYSKDGTPVTLVPSTPEFVFTLKDGTVIIPHINADIFYSIRGNTTKMGMADIIHLWERGGNFEQFLKIGFINFKDTDKYTMLVPVIEKPLEGGQRRKTRNYKNKYSRRVSLSSRKYKTRR